MNRTNIDWADYSWNPIKGMCPVDCKTPDGKSYCYARKMYSPGFYSKKKPFDNLDIRFEFHESLERQGKEKIKDGSKIFICSTMEIFHPKVKSEWRDLIFKSIKLNPKYTFQILTKMPENIDRPMPDNVWLGVSVTNQADAIERIPKLLQTQAKVRFVSIEPMLEAVYLSADYHDYLVGWDVGPEHHQSCDGSCEQCPIPVQYQTEKLDWVIVGKLSGYGKKHDPQRDYIESILFSCGINRVPIFLKNNLKDIWGEDLIQEFPK